MTFQDLRMTLQQFWVEQGCLIKRVQWLARRCATTYLNLEGDSPLLNQSA
jgi:glycyl-tRNA synthetase alpha subunit